MLNNDINILLRVLDTDEFLLFLKKEREIEEGVL
jgi:hypothetical protein